MGIDWYGPILEYLQKGYFKNNIPKKETSHIIVKSRPYTLYDKVLYKLGPNNILKQCYHPLKLLKYLRNYMKDLPKDILALTPL
jgi:hypothetical protein